MHKIKERLDLSVYAKKKKAARERGRQAAEGRKGIQLGGVPTIKMAVCQVLMRKPRNRARVVGLK